MNEQQHEAYWRGYNDAKKAEPVIDTTMAVRIATQLGWEPPRKPVELTDGEIEKMWADNWDGFVSFVEASVIARAVIAAYEAKQGEQK